MKAIKITFCDGSLQFFLREEATFETFVSIVQFKRSQYTHTQKEAFARRGIDEAQVEEIEIGDAEFSQFVSQVMPLI